MRIDIRKIFGDIENRQRENDEAKDFIKEKEAECAAAIRGPKDLIEWNDMVINMFYNTRISVSLKDILDEIAKIVDKDRERLSIEIDDPVGLKHYKMTKGQWISWIFQLRNERRGDATRMGDMVITIKLDNKEIAKLTAPFDAKAIQNDGKYMYEHLDFVELKEGDVGYLKDKNWCKVVIADKENIMVDYTIKQICAAQNGNTNSWIPGIVLQAILNISDSENLQAASEGMNKS